MKQHNTIVWLLFVVRIFTGLMSSEDVCQTPICHQTALNLLQSMDSSLNPCEDFYLYACANFIRDNPVPSDKYVYGQFNRIHDDITAKVQEILSTGEEVVNMSRPLARAIAFFNTCLAANESVSEVLTVVVDDLGGSPLMNNGNWSSDSYDFISSLKNSMLLGNSPLFQVAVDEDQKNTSANILYIDQVEMKIDDDYYLKPENYEEIVRYYKEFIINSTVALVGDVSNNTETMAEEIFNFETAITNITSSIVDKQNSTRRYNRMTIGQLQNLTDPGFHIIDWTEFLRNLVNIDDITEDEPIIVHEPTYMSRLFSILNSTNINSLANYMSWSFVHHISFEAFGQLEQTFYQFHISAGIGITNKKRWENCVELVSKTWSHAIGQSYISQFTNDSSRSQAEDMLMLLQKSFIDRLNRNSLMDNDTRSKAIEKVQGMLLMVGYPDWINDNVKFEQYYEKFPNTTGHYLMDHLIFVRASNEVDLAGLRDSPDFQKFSESPLDVNAYYSPTGNSITVPMGVLHPPLYHNGAPSATNFGGLGTMLGHEITHGFDNEGRKYDQNGNLQSWWPQSVVDRFEVRSECFVRQYNQCCPIVVEGTEEEIKCVNGRQTLGENIADNGGLRASYQAWKEWTEENGEDLKLPVMENFTSAQIFYLSYANFWCETNTVRSLLQDLCNSEHAPNSCRVNGALANSANFARAFNCSRGPMNRGRKRCWVW